MKLFIRVLSAIFWFAGFYSQAATFRVATYNVENYLDTATQTRHAKPADAKAKVSASILALQADVLALEEMGERSALEELRASLKSGGIDYPYWEHVTGYDTNIHLAILSRFPFSALRPHTNDNFLLDGKRFQVSRGFAEADIQVTKNYSFTVLVAHLKSKRKIAQADEADLRLEEAKVLREKIDAVFQAKPNANLVVLGDLNDTKDAPSTKAVIGRGKYKLVDTRPSERALGAPIAVTKGIASHDVVWTHYFSKEDLYSRLDYILLSPGMAREWDDSESFVLAMPEWSIASDHRPLVAAFAAEDK